MEIEDLEDLWSTASEEKLITHLNWLVDTYNENPIVSEHSRGIAVSQPLWDALAMSVCDGAPAQGTLIMWKGVEIYVDDPTGS